VSRACTGSICSDTDSTPPQCSRVQPVVIVTEAMKMFDVECHQMDVRLEFIEDETLKGLEWVMLDPSRLLQILINLL
jgi:C4-dicarboxylate-specific signal transduction histidine kinase